MLVNNEFDVIVVGVGGMGSATVYELASRGFLVLGIDRYNIPNHMGSSHGISKIIRLAYHEDPSYVPLVRRSYELWHRLEQMVDERLLVQTGTIRGGPEHGAMFSGSLKACQIHELGHEVLDADALKRRFPSYTVPSGTMSVVQREGGFLLSEKCISSYVFAALELGAHINGRERVVNWEPTDLGVIVETDKGAYSAKHLVISSGSWVSSLVPQLLEFAKPEKQVVGWFRPLIPELFTIEQFPVFGLEVKEGRFYGFPDYDGRGLKVGCYHHFNEQVDPDDFDRAVSLNDEVLLRDFIGQYFPAALGSTLALQTCLFTNTPDGHFILDRHPEYPQVLLAAGFSGHGFKFASVVGEIMADLVEHKESDYDLGLFKLSRFLNN